jgi:hypothetical protein
MFSNFHVVKFISKWILMLCIIFVQFKNLNSKSFICVCICASIFTISLLSLAHYVGIYALEKK